MKEKSYILFNLAKNGWTLHIAWKKETMYLVLDIEAYSEFRNERRYTAQHKEEVNRLLLFEDMDYYINYIELNLLNKLYDKMLIEQGTKVL